MLEKIIDTIGGWMFEAFNFILLLLPLSPFQSGALAFPSQFRHFLGYLNYYIPFRTMNALMWTWLAAIVIYYAYSIILRFIKAIK